MDNQNQIQEQINRYVYQVSRFLMVKNKEDIEKEIRTLIDDMLDEKCQGRPATQNELDAVFTELGKPMELAAKYNDNKRYLIGPALFPIYWRVLGYVSIGVVILSFISMLVSAVKDGAVWNGFGEIFNAALSAFAVVTIIFAVIEWRGLSLESFTQGDLKLPPVPRKNERISRAEPVFAILSCFVLILILVSIPQYLGVWIAEQKRFVSVFDIDVIQSVAPIIILSIGISIVEAIYRLIDGRYTIRVMISTIICRILTFSLTVLILKGFPIWNLNLPADLAASGVIKDISSIPANWNVIVSNVLIGLTAFGTAVEIIQTVYRTIQYANND